MTNVPFNIAIQFHLFGAMTVTFFASFVFARCDDDDHHDENDFRLRRFDFVALDGRSRIGVGGGARIADANRLFDGADWLFVRVID